MLEAAGECTDCGHPFFTAELMSWLYSDLDGYDVAQHSGDFLGQNIPPTPYLGHLAPLYLALHVTGGQIILPVLIATCLWAKPLLRHPTLINFFVSWSIYSVVACLLLYTGNADNAVNSPVGPLCFAQSALLHGSLPMSATATLVVVVQAWSMFHQPELGPRKPVYSMGLISKLALPYAVFLVFTAVTIVLQQRYPGYVHAWNGIYCTYYRDPFRRYGVTIYCIIVVFLILSIEVAIGIRYYYTCCRISSIFPLADRATPSPSLIVRLALFNLYSLVSLGTGIIFVSNKTHPWPYMIQAGMPLVVALVFGCQKDFFLAWCFWKKKRKCEMQDPILRCRKLNSVADLLKRTPSPSIAPTPSVATPSQVNIGLCGA